MKLVDTHTHLEQVEEVAQALDRARASNVAAVVAVGMNLASNKQILDLSSKYPDLVFPALGIHPWALEAEEMDETIEFVESHIATCVGVGEIGLDYWLKKKDKKLQREVFGKLLDIAKKHDKPVSTHSRGSYEDVFRMVRESGVKSAVFHWYSGPLEITREILRCGYYVSATPAVEYSEKHREVIACVPLENLLLETDCPVKYHDVKSEPANVNVALQEVARLKGENPDLVASVTTKNAIALFNLPISE
jgi:TatD DNase family protein